MIRKFVLYSLFTGLASCSGPMDELSGLEGTWTGIQDGNEFSETWTRSTDSKFTGLGTGMMGGDTVFKEKLKIELMGEEIFYIADPNDEGPVNFRLTEVKDDIFTFENKEHDFPQQIIYSLAKQDTLLIQLIGTHNGQPAVEQLALARKK